MNDEYVVIKLVDGDQLMARLINETAEGVLVSRPITVRLVPVMSDGETSERMLTSVYCSVSDQESFIFDSRHVISVNRLHPKMIDHYINLSDTLYENLKNPENFKRTDRQEVKPKSTLYH